MTDSGTFRFRVATLEEVLGRDLAEDAAGSRAFGSLDGDIVKDDEGRTSCMD